MNKTPKNAFPQVVTTPLDDIELDKSKRIDIQSWAIEQFQQNYINLDDLHPDPLLLARYDPNDLLRHGILPWQKNYGRLLIFAADEKNVATQEYLHQQGEPFILIPFPKDKIHQRIAKLYSATLLRQARNHCPSQNSVRSLPLLPISVVTIFFMSTVYALADYLNISIWYLLILICASFTLGNSILRFCAIFQGKSRPKTPNPKIKPKMISLLVPLFHEELVVDKITAYLKALNYPAEYLEVKFLIEENDPITASALESIYLPQHFEVLTIPKDHLQTKPKALNFALPFCRGELIGIYDAEDRPEPDQLSRVVHAFDNLPEKTACIQCQLDFYNTDQNWFSRCFTIEYRIWFFSILPFVKKIGLAVPLGGTSLFIKHDILKSVGGWDAHNVTEDADLGIRLKRAGYETDVVLSKTLEEANTRSISWIRQRSRWLKGYLLTWMVHMRDPKKLWQDLGPLGFIGIQLMFLGTCINTLALPLYLLMWGAFLGIDVLDYSTSPIGLRLFIAFSLLFAQASNLALAFKTLYFEKRSKYLFKWYLSMIFYWPFGTIAMYKAIMELIFRPFFWDKTEHGIDEYPNARRPSPSSEASS